MSQNVREIPLPQLDAVEEVTLAAWLKQPGDRVAMGEVIAEVLTEKVNIEITAPVAGVIEAILAAVGDTVAAGQPIARIVVRTGDADVETP